MEFKTNLREVGGSYYLIVPKAILDVFGLLNFLKDYEYKIIVNENGKIISYKRIKKIIDKAQTKIDDYRKNGKK